MPTGAPNFIVDANANTAKVTRVGQVKTNEVFDTIKPAYHESITAASGGTQLADIPVGKLYIESLSGNGIMYVGGLDTDAPFSGRGIRLKPDDVNPVPLELPISNANQISVCATVSGQLISYWGFLNADNVTLDPTRQGTAPDVEPPVLLSSIPYSGTSNIGISDVTLLGYFNEDLDPQTVNISSVIVRQSGQLESTSISGTVDLFSNLIAFEPENGQLAYGSWYTTYYTPLISDLVGNFMQNSASFTFQTMAAPDTSGPIFLSSDPVNAESGVGSNIVVAAYFNEALDPLSVTESSLIVRISGGVTTAMASGVPSISFDQLSARLTMVSGQLAFTSWYNAYVTADIADLAGNATASTSFSFLTASAPDTSGPIYLSSDPLSGTAGISTNGVTFFAYFNESVDGNSIDLSSFMIRNSGSAASTKVSGTVQVSPGNPKVAQLLPVSGQLAVSAWYNAFLTTQVKDLVGNAMSVSGKFSFLTAGEPPPPPPVVLSSVPASGSIGFDVSSNLTVTMDRDCSGALTSMATVMSVITASGNVFSGTTTFDNVGKRLFTFDPTNTLTYSQLSNIRVSGIYSTSGTRMTPISIPFTTMPIPAAPTIASSVPVSGAIGIDVSGNVIIFMTSDCSGSAASMASVMRIVDSSGNVFTGTTTFSTTTARTFTFDPTSTLNFGQVQNVKVSGIYDRIGQVMTPVTLPFTTATSPTPPGLSSSNPASGSSNFTITSDLTVTMDEVCSGVTSTMATVLKVTCSGVNFPGVVTFDTAGKKTFTLNPTGSLAYSMPSTLTVSGICDVNGNFMTPIDIPFTTADPALNHFYIVSPTISTHRFDNSSTRHAEKRDASGSDLNGRVIRQVKVYLKRTTGSPNTTIKCVIRRDIENADSIQTTINSMSSLSLTNAFALYTFTNLSNTYQLTTNDAISIETTLTGSDEIGIQTGTGYDSNTSFYTRFDGTYNDQTSEDLAGDMYT